MTFPKSAVRAWMKRTHTSQKQLAEALSVSEPTISLVFKGERHLPLEAAGRLSDLSGIPVEKLLTGDDAMRLLKLLGKRMNSTDHKSGDKANVA